jgi:hypothetical protein
VRRRLLAFDMARQAGLIGGASGPLKALGAFPVLNGAARPVPLWRPPTSPRRA